MDKECYAHWNDPVAIMNAVIAHAEGAAPRPAALECNRRSALLARTARQFGYRSRYIWIYHSRRNLDSHTFLEILKGSVGTFCQVQKSNCRDETAYPRRDGKRGPIEAFYSAASRPNCRSARRP
jgi:hypothetical protein